jgi:hypothetical protein
MIQWENGLGGLGGWTRIFFLSFPCHSLVIPLSFPCHSLVIPLSFPCHSVGIGSFLRNDKGMTRKNPRKSAQIRPIRLIRSPIVSQFSKTKITNNLSYHIQNEAII